MNDRLGDKTRMFHIRDAINEIEKYITDLNYDEFSKNSMIQFATVKQLEIIGEAASRISVTFKRIHPEIEWREIISLRNILVHEYFEIDKKVIWDILIKNIPSLKNDILEIVSNL